MKNLPKICPLATWDFPKGFKPTKDNCQTVFNIDKEKCECCFPAWFIRFGGASITQCPECTCPAQHYLNCNVFSSWFWRGQYKNKLKKKNNKRNPLDSKLRHEVFKRDKYKCIECGATNKEKTLHCDHIISVAQGGSDEMSNLQTLCDNCNLAKSDKCWEGNNGRGESATNRKN